jgi:hypothetical protein
MLFVNAQAQEPAAATTASGPVSKSGVAILPAAGDFAIGIDALPYINFLGNMFNDSYDQSLNPYSNNIYLRYHLSETDAVRVILSISNNTNIHREYLQDDAARFADPLSQALVQDKRTSANKSMSINIAYQKNRGYGRLRGIYGAQINYGYGSSSSTYQYGNKFTTANSSPNTFNFSNYTVGRVNERSTIVDDGISQSAGIGAIGGIEYYFMPKTCIGFEIDLGCSVNWKSQGFQTTEQLSGSSIVEMDKPYSPSGLTARGINTFTVANYTGLYVMFHF